jgi:hypothetical protein
MPHSKSAPQRLHVLIDILLKMVGKTCLSGLKRLVAIYPISGHFLRKNPPGTLGLSL